MSEVNQTQKAWKSPVAIGSLLALVFFVVKYWIGFEIPMFDEFVTLLIAAMVSFGIFNNPTSKNTF